MESRERAALARVEDLRAEFERVRMALAEAEELLNRRVVGLEEYLETLAELGDMESAAVGEPSQPVPVRRSAVSDAPPTVAGGRQVVARKEDGIRVEALGPDYRRIMAVLEKAEGDGLSAREVAAGLGWDTSLPARVEGARGRMKRLVDRGWLTESRPGLFTLPAPDAAAADGQADGS